MTSTSIRLDDYLDADRDPNEPIPTISLGEDEDNGDSAYAEGIAASNDAKRLVDVKTALEELQLVADQIENATEKDLLLVDTALSAAVAGTDITPDEIAPGLEQYVGKRISTEGIGSFIKAIWDAIMSVLKKIWNMFASFFNALFGRAARSEKKAKKLEDSFRQKHNAKQKQAAFVLGNEGNNLVLKGKIPGNKHDIEEILNANEKFLTDLEKYISVCNGVGNKLKDAIGKFDESNPESSLNAITDALDDVSKNNTGLDLHPLKGDVRYKDGTFAGYHLAGNKWVIAVLPITLNLPEHSAYIIKNNAARATRYAIEANIPNLNNPQSPTFKALSGDEGQGLAQRVEAASVRIQTFAKKYERLEDKNEIKAVTKACDTLTKRLEGKQGSMSQEQITAYKNAVNVAVTYNDLLSKFVAESVRTVEMANENILSVLKKALDNLE